VQKEELLALARQLACPEGERGLELGSLMNVQNALLVERAVESLAPGAGEYILEIGLGNGQLSLPVIRAIGTEGRFIGVEKSPLMAQQAQDRFIEESLMHAEVIIHDCRCFSMEENTLDGVLAVNVLYFIDDIVGLFHQTLRWLKPGGRLVIGLRSPESLKTMPFTSFGFRARGLCAIRDTLLEAGFADIEAQYHDDGETSLAGQQIALDSLVIKASKKT